MPGRTSTKDGLQSLVNALNERLGPSSGIDSDDVDAAELQHLMEEYVSNESEWAKYFFPSPHVPYTRNLVDKGNGKCNLVRPQFHQSYETLLTNPAYFSMGARQTESDS
jgi:cysteine dioxygenase